MSTTVSTHVFYFRVCNISNLSFTSNLIDCNSTLVDAVKDGPESVVAWAQTLLVYGPVSLAPSYETLVNEREELVKNYARQRDLNGAYREDILRADLSALLRMVSLSECVAMLSDCMARDVAGRLDRTENNLEKP